MPDATPPTARPQATSAAAAPPAPPAAGGERVTHAPDPPPAQREVPCLCDGVELIGRYEDSGFKEPPYIARRADGQVVQLPQMLFALAEQIDGHRDVDQIAEAFSHAIERDVDPQIVTHLLDEQLRPLGIAKLADGSAPEVQSADPLLALKFRTKVVPASLVTAVTNVLRPLFLPPVMAVALLAFVAVDVWLLGFHGISQGLREVLYQPALILALLGGVVVATTMHEFGHATAVRYGGAKPGVMGVGVYIVWPAFYTDITDAYRLGKWGRLRADTGGMYFNTLFALAMTGLYAATRWEPLLLLVVLQNIAIIQQSLPLLRLDGYYIISDLTGVPDMLTRIKPVLRSLLPGRPEDDRVKELKPWVKRVVTGYVLVVVPALLLLFGVMLVHAPRAFATGYDSVMLHWGDAKDAFGDGSLLTGLAEVLQCAVLVLPGVGFVYTVVRLGGRGIPAAWRWAGDGGTWRAPALASGTAAAVGLLAFLWWPSENYRPIQPGERGTLASAVRSLRDVPTGRAPLPPQRVRELGGAPLRSSEQQRERGAEEPTRERTETRREEPAATTPTETAPAEEQPAPAQTTAPAQTAPPAETVPPAQTAPPAETTPLPSEQQPSPTP